MPTINEPVPPDWGGDEPNRSELDKLLEDIRSNVMSVLDDFARDAEDLFSKLSAQPKSGHAHPEATDGEVVPMSRRGGGDAVIVLRREADLSPVSFAASEPRQKFRKDVIARGQYVHPTERWSLDVDRERMDKWIEAFGKMKTAGISVPFSKDHGQTSADVLGTVVELTRVGDELQAVVEAIGAESISLAQRVNQVSLEIAKDYRSGTGEDFGECVVAISLTPTPVVPHQREFEKIAASRTAGESSLTESMVAASRGVLPDHRPTEGELTSEMSAMAYPSRNDEGA